MFEKIVYSFIGVAVLASVVLIAATSSGSQSVAEAPGPADIQSAPAPTTFAASSSATRVVSASTIRTSAGNTDALTELHYGVRTKTSNCSANQPLPDHACSPGAVLTTDTTVICRSGYTQTVRDVPTSEKEQVFAEYGIDWAQHSGYEVDHVISLELGGSNDISNLFAESYSIPYGARVKDKLENHLHEQVCSGAIDVTIAQQEIATDWLNYYHVWQNSGASVPSSSASTQASEETSTPPTVSSDAAYYTSSYGSSKYFYPAECNAWKSLSPSYLVSFGSLDALLTKYPTRTLSPGCH